LVIEEGLSPLTVVALVRFFVTGRCRRIRVFFGALKFCGEEASKFKGTNKGPEGAHVSLDLTRRGGPLSLCPNGFMSRSGKAALGMASISCVGLVAYWSHACDATRLFLELSVPVFLAACILACFPIFRAEDERRRIGWRGFVPLVFVLALPVASIFMSWPISAALFRWRFPSYEALVHRIETNAIPVSTNVVHIPPEQATARLCEAVWAQKTSNILVVEFDTDIRGFPAHSAGYIYCSGDRIPQGSFAERRIAAQIQPHWYYFVY
jgi:hypothetical protein